MSSKCYKALRSEQSPLENNIFIIHSMLHSFALTLFPLLDLTVFRLIGRSTVSWQQGILHIDGVIDHVCIKMMSAVVNANSGEVH